MLMLVGSLGVFAVVGCENKTPATPKAGEKMGTSEKMTPPEKTPTPPPAVPEKGK